MSNPDSKAESRLIIVSNRITQPGAAEAGGLAVALEESLRRQGGIWCGWSGAVRETPKTTRETIGNVDYLTIDLTRQEHHDYYIGYSNSLLWPLFHYRTDLAHFSQASFKGYQQVNRRFADTIASHAAPADVIWVHDYHLMTLAGHLRDKGLKNRIGFFLHIPFPVPEILAALPNYAEILKGLCAYDLIGFQTESDLSAFKRAVTELMGGHATANVGRGVVDLVLQGRTCRAGVFPISIDTAAMVTAAQGHGAALAAQQMRRGLGDRALVIGVDRLDYTKGLGDRLRGFECFLEHYPNYRRQVSYVQITPPSRTDVKDYRTMRQQVEEQTARINGTYADIDWEPIRYINKSYSRDKLAGFYRIARVALVTPLRDGMNLVAKEFVAAQDPNDPGVLVLSGFAGAVAELGGGAIVVNPYDMIAVSNAIAQALTMPLDERKERHRAMMDVLIQNDIHHWSKSFFRALTAPRQIKSLSLLLAPTTPIRERAASI